MVLVIIIDTNEKVIKKGIFMSGHSKWSTIKHKKAKTDSLRAAEFQKFSREIIVASKLGGPDPAGNFRLRTAIEKAKAAGLPNDNIKRAIEKGSGAGNNENYDEMIYEGYAAGGVAVVIEAMTDNKNRTAGDIRSYFTKFNGNLGETGCVGWMFDKKGCITFNKDDVDYEKLFEAAINLDAEDIRGSVDEFEKAIGQAQMIMFPGGFSAGDEPDGSAKFITSVFRNERIKEAVHRLLQERDGLALGICNGFQALVKLGLVPYGEIKTQKDDSPTLTTNSIGRHISKSVYTKVVTNKSPLLRKATLGGVYAVPASHGEGRFVASKEWIDKLFENGQVATQYADFNGNISMDEEWNVNGSYAAIEGITSPDGRCFGKMAHVERRGESVAINIYGEQDLKIFESGVKYFK